jgi:hypothetical protein
VRRGLFASFLAGETRPTVRDAGFFDAAAREAARGTGLLDVAVGWCATAGFRGVVSEKSVFRKSFSIYYCNFQGLLPSGINPG